MPNDIGNDNTDNNVDTHTSGEAVNRLAIIAVIGLFMASPILVLFAHPITAFTESVAKQQFDSKSYVDAVLSKQALPGKKN